ncbi:MAG TPA: DUF1553 domain-containing protein [Gemmataceae bacterium]|jgi:hypothetical protein|nr:DUF1553 domain-containing protein [Gemmataceae bacterium]
MRRICSTACGILGLCLFLTSALLADPPAGSDKTKAALALAKRIDEHIAAGWKAQEVTAAPLADDAEFFRRIHLDIAGRIPVVMDVRDFLADQRPDKRQRIIDKLLEGKLKDDGSRDLPAGYIKHFSNVWRREWLPQTLNNPQFQFYGPQFEGWLQQKLQANTPYDQLVRSLLTAPLNPQGNGPYDPYSFAASSFLYVNEMKPENLGAAASRLFLGIKIECAQCHNHPLDKWKREQFWEFASFFAGFQPIGQFQRRAPAEQIEIRSLTIPDLDKKVSAKFLDGKEPKFKDDVSSRFTLVDWMTAKENPYFARNAVNRVWNQFFGNGLIDPIDEPGDQNPPSHPELLEELSKAFVDSGYDLKFLIRAIVSSQAYQRSSAAPGASATTERTFARMKVRGLTPEQLFDSLSQATYFTEDESEEQRRFGQLGQARAEFVAKFSSTERPSDLQTSILQALTMMNGRFVGVMTSTKFEEIEKKNTRHLLAAIAKADFMSTSDKIEALYLATLSRVPRPEEIKKLIEYVDTGGPSGDKNKALADVYWALLNSSEFGFNH